MPIVNDQGYLTTGRRQHVRSTAERFQVRANILRALLARLRGRFFLRAVHLPITLRMLALRSSARLTKAASLAGAAAIIAAPRRGFKGPARPMAAMVLATVM